MRLMDEVKAYPYGNCGYSNPGYFAVDEYPVVLSSGATINSSFQGWQSCREVVQLQWKLDHHRGIWFAHDKGELEGIIEFMTWVERTLCIPDGERSRVSNADKPKIVWIEPASFWRACEMRKNIFTMFLRVARYYAKQPPGSKSIACAIEAYVYSRETKVALERFLLGFHDYDGPPIKAEYLGAGHIEMGWHRFFGKKDLAHCRQHLKSA